MQEGARPPLHQEQYRDSTKLSARTRLYRRFSKNPQSLHGWVFGHLCTRVERDVLELGCGPGNFWKANAVEVPADWRISLMDLSLGMVREARHSLAALPGETAFLVGDAQNIPLASDSIDAVIANHMLYHVPDLDRAFTEIGRVLHSGGWLLAATNGRDHLKEMRNLVYEVDDGIEFGFRDAYGQDELSFSLENGRGQLESDFVNVQLAMFEDGLLITEVEPVIEYVTSYPGNARSKLLQADLADQLRERIREAMDQEGVFRVTTRAGLFLAQNT